MPVLTETGQLFLEKISNQECNGWSSSFSLSAEQAKA
jgi:hypothetical protein